MSSAGSGERAQAGGSRALVLASGSPQRRELLARLGVPFTVRVSGASELEQGTDVAALAVENALRKARAALLAGRREVVLGCDTIVVLDGVVYGKPTDEAAARRTLSALAGRTHEVISGVALLLADRDGTVEQRTAHERTKVSFGAIERVAARLLRRDRGVARTIGRICGAGRGREVGARDRRRSRERRRPAAGTARRAVPRAVRRVIGALRRLSACVRAAPGAADPRERDLPAKPLANLSGGERRPLDCATWRARPTGALHGATAEHTQV